MNSMVNLTVARKTFWAALFSLDLGTCRRIVRMVLR